MRFASLGSGSEGNGLLVQADIDEHTVTILIDCGFGRKECFTRLAALGVDPSALDAILVTHEHSDHLGGVSSLARALQIPVFLTRGTALAGGVSFEGMEFIDTVAGKASFDIAGLEIKAITVPHDSREPVQFVIDDGSHRLGVLTDIGHVSEHVVSEYQGLTSLVIETNHDPKLLATSQYPASLKRRISGQYGHLANEQAGDFLARIERNQLGVIVAAHLSRQNNTKSLATGTLAEVLGVSNKDFWVADQDTGLQWLPAK